MNKEKAKIRLYCSEFFPEAPFILDEKTSHYLITVMRRKVDDVITVFNEKMGDWLCVIQTPHKKETILRCVEKIRNPVPTPSLTLYFTPLKKQPLFYLIQKATECGVTDFRSVVTDYTDKNILKIDRLEATALEASEQSGRFDCPVFHESVSLKTLLEQVSQDTILYVGAEDGRGESLDQVFDKNKKTALAIGPEGGFSPAEFDQFSNHPSVRFIDLGSRILRAETAAVAGLTLINHQRSLG